MLPGATLSTLSAGLGYGEDPQAAVADQPVGTGPDARVEALLAHDLKAGASKARAPLGLTASRGGKLETTVFGVASKQTAHKSSLDHEASKRGQEGHGILGVDDTIGEKHPVEAASPELRQGKAALLGDGHHFPGPSAGPDKIGSSTQAAAGIEEPKIAARYGQKR